MMKSCFARTPATLLSLGLLLTLTTLTNAVTTVNLVAIVGQPVAGSGGLSVTNLNTAYVSGSGKVGFLGTLSDSSRFVYYDNSILFRDTDVMSPALSGGEGTIGVGNMGEFAYSPSIDGNDGVFSHIGTLIRGGDPAPGMPGLFNTFGSRPRMTADGTAYWVGGVTDVPGGSTTQRRVFWKGETSGGVPVLTPMLMGGDFIAGWFLTNTGIEFPYSVSENNAHFINRVTFTDPPPTDAAVILNGTTIVAREGSPVGGGGGNWQAFRFVGVNNSGNWIVYGDDDTVNDDILMYNGTVLTRQGEMLAGLTLGTTIDAAVLNNMDEIVQLWDLAGGGEALFWGPAANIGSSTVLLRTGDELDTTGNGMADWLLTDFNASATITDPFDFGDDGRVFAHVTLTPIAGGPAVQAIVGLAVPEPSLTGAVCIALCAVLHRNRRRKMD